ncbi:tRNA (adenosine(37)-N6)-dimethylallyltransferase MiaA [Corticibacter populi]|uniref:tRNA dimethylallyltransferase n=2 Tax=Corticibacter populi TaxID=1550736 RepID=A0A3M6QMG1_9BURK|nr:tRNA (adenosine(37)-N6)-dimethylallyltransferase MiaA [Corticibacter populi]
MPRRPDDLRFFILTGPTACGKSALALALAEAVAAERPLEIISVDSALVYRGMDIGTAKPSAAELAQVPHHLIDIRAPHQPYSAAEFVRDCMALVDAIHARGAFPLLVGGTMLYIHALLHGLDALPQADAAVRAQLEAEAATRGWPAMHAWLAQVDPVAAARLPPNDSQRIQRALEVWLVSGQPISALQTRTPQSSAWQADWLRTHMLSLEPASRTWLHERIGRRFEAMLGQGFLAEVERLRADPLLHAELPSIRSVGYRQAWQALDGVFPMAELSARAEAATRQLAKRQITWLRAMTGRQIAASDQLDAAQLRAQALALLRPLLADSQR